MSITNGKDKSLTSGGLGLPNMSETIVCWFQPMTFFTIVRTIVNFKALETKTAHVTKGVKQPMKAQEVALKPEGQRDWEWITIHCLPDLILAPQEIVEYDGNKFRVMKKSDFKEYGYLMYEMVEDFDGDS